jgi:hypothetical protein
MKVFIRLVLFALLSFACSHAVFASVRVPDRMVQLVQYVPSRQELIRLNSAGVEFLFVQLATYPDRYQAKDLASFEGNLTMVLSVPTAPDSLQVIALNELKGPVWLFVNRIPDVYGCNRLAELKNDVKLYVMSQTYPGGMEIQNLGRITRPMNVVITGAYPDSMAAERMNSFGANVKLSLNLNAYQFTVRNINKITRKTTLFINKTSSPGSQTEAGYLAQLTEVFSVFIGRTFSAQMVLDRLLGALLGQ